MLFLKRFGWWLILVLLILVGFWRLRFDVDILNLLPAGQPTVQGLKLYQRHFANARELIITLRTPEPGKLETLTGALAARLRQEEKLIESVSWQPPWMEDPGQLAELLGCMWLNQPPEIFGELTNRLAPDQLPLVLAETKEVLSTSLSPMDIAKRAFDPFNLLNLPALTNMSGISMEQGQKLFSTTEGTYRVVFIQARPELPDYLACSSWLKAVKSIVAELRGKNRDWDDVEVHYTGRPVFVTEIAASMQSDMSGSVVGTAVIIALLFWLTHRRWLPMLWLLVLLAAILAATLALGGLVLGAISVVSIGFAAILLGLAVDYAVVHYQEALAHPLMTVPEIRRAIAPSILWAAITTISAFLVLNLGGLPGLAQLGTLVAIGVALAALVMVMFFLPPLFPERRKPATKLAPVKWWSYLIPPRQAWPAEQETISSPDRRRTWLLTGLILLVASGILGWRRPGLDSTGNALRPQRGEAESTLEEMTTAMGLPKDVLWVILSGNKEEVVYQRLSQTEALLNQARSNGVISQYLLPTAMWPRAEFQAANRNTALELGKQGVHLKEAALRAGFTTNATFLTEELLRLWQRAGTAQGVLWPTNQVSQWLLKRFMTRTTNDWQVMGIVYPSTNRVATSDLIELSAKLYAHEVLLSGWELLGTATLKRVQERFWLVLAPMVILVLISLWLAFHRLTEVWLGLAVLLLSGLCLLAVMAVAGWRWNLLNLLALPLMLGTGVDYSIFIQQALRRLGGNRDLVRCSVGRALLLCGGTTMAGFGSLAWSSYPGMASLGLVCATGVGANMLIAVFLLPSWWAMAAANSRPTNPNHATAMAPRTVSSSFYRASLWRLGLVMVRALPAWLVNGCFVLVAEFHFHWQRQRREVVMRNLLPACGGDTGEAVKTTRRLYRNFARKLADLWRVESGLPVRNWVTHPDELKIIQTAWGRGRGVLFVTLHLGNWEHGGLLLTKLGIKLTVLTLAEPDQKLTEIRAASRARWGIDTLILGQDGFAFVEVIKRLQAGESLAIALDRPPQRNAARVELFGKPFHASLVAAELARASGCALLGVTIVRHADGFAVKLLPEFGYSRQALGNRAARRDLTQQIVRAFEPDIRQNLDQWYQFIPIWPKDE